MEPRRGWWSSLAAARSGKGLRGLTGNGVYIGIGLTIIAALKTFDLVYVTTSGGPGNATTVPSFEVYNRAFNLKDVGSASAVAVVLTALVFVINAGISRIGETGVRR